MGRLDHLTLDDLHGELERTAGNKPVQRVLAAIGRKQGASLGELAERHNVTEKTIRNWLDRFEERPLAEAPYDDDRSGRPTKLSNEQLQQLFEELEAPPSSCGYNRERWEPELVKNHLEEHYGVVYSLRHVYRLLEEAGHSGTHSRGTA